MLQKISRKIKGNLSIYKHDIKTKGLYFSIIHRLYKIPLPKNILIPLINILRPNFTLIDNFKLYIDKSDRIVSEKLLVYKKWEEYETKIFKENLKTGDTVLDIGAHIGYYTLIASNKVGKRGKVYAFEPDPKNFKLLKKNISENGCSNVALINSAVTLKGGQIKLFLNKENKGDHRAYDSKDGRESISINSMKLDEYFKNNKKVDVIKMDIQGGEFKALKGGLNLLSHNKRIKIFSEFWPMGLRLNNDSPKEYLNLLIKNKFKIFQISEEKEKLIPVKTIQLLSLFSKDDSRDTNLFCKK